MDEKREYLKKLIHEIIEEELNKCDKNIDESDIIKKVLNREGNYEKELTSKIDDDGYIIIDKDSAKDMNELDKREYYKISTQTAYHYYDKGIKKLKKITSVYGITSATIGITKFLYGVI